MAVSQRRHLTVNALVKAAAVAAAVVLSYLLTHRGAAWAGAALAAPCVGAWVLRRAGNGLLLAVALLLVVPYWYPHIWLMAPIVATLGLVRGVAATRLHAVDLAVGLLAVVFATSWLFHPELDVPVKALVQSLLPVGFYVWARLTITDRLLPRLQWGILVAASIGACTVLYSAARGAEAFVPQQSYQWAGSTTAVFRPGGIFGGSPTAAIVLSCVLLASVGLYRSRPRVFAAAAAVILAAIAVTLDRAGPLGLALGFAVLAVLLPYRHWGRVVMATFALSIPVYALTSSPATLSAVTASKFVNAGVLRTSTVSGRVNLAADSVQLVADSPSHFMFGRGFRALAGTGTHDARLVANIYLWDVQHGPNDDYLRALLEQGLLGLTALVAWLGGSLLLGIRTSLRLPKGSGERTVVAGLTAATLSYMVAAATHDLSNDWTDLAIGALLTGILVSACTAYGKGRRSAGVDAAISLPGAK